MTTTDTAAALTAAVRELSEREAELTAHLLVGMAYAQEESGHRRPAAVWRALGAVLMAEVDRQRQVLAAAAEGLVEDDGAS